MRSEPTLSLRPFAPSDMPALVALIARAKPREAMTAEQIEAQMRFAATAKTMQRMLAWDGGKLAGSMGYGYSIGKPTEPWAFKLVVPDDGRYDDVAARLFTHLKDVMRRHGASELLCQVREDDAADVRFHAAQGFREYARQWESLIDLATCDVERLAPLRPLPEGVTLTTIAERGRDAAFDRALHELFLALIADVPSPEPIPAPSPQTFEQTFFDAQQRRPELFFLALENGAPVGLLVHREHGASGDSLHIDFLGIRRTHRNGGLALALKLAGMRAAKALGYREIRTWNDTANERVLVLNERLGFLRQPAWVNLRAP